MKHGDKKKGKASKASIKKGSAAGKSSKAASSKAKAKTSAPKSSVPKPSPKTSSSQAPTGTPGRARGSTPDGGFTNPAIGAAFKHAVKKYPNAFRRLTD